MNTSTIIILLLIVALIIIAELLVKNTKTPKEEKRITEYPYKQKYLLTKTEYKFYKTLKPLCDQNQIIICPKVRLEDFIEVTSKDNKQKYRGYIKSRHIDFLLCDTSLYIKAAIELDDKSHNTTKAQETDELKNNIFKAINIPLYRINVIEQDYETKLKEIINTTLTDDAKL